MSSRVSKMLKLGAPVLFGVLMVGCEVATFSNDSYRKGLQLYDQGNYTDSAGSFHNAVRQNPKAYKSHYMLGLSQEQLGQTQRAIAAYKSARDIRWETLEGIQDGDTATKIYDGLARTIAKTADKDVEINLLRQRAQTARNGEDLIIIARVFKQAGDPDSAIATYQEVVTKYPREQWYAKEYGLYLKSLGLNDRARQVLTEASRLRPDKEIEAALQGL